MEPIKIEVELDLARHLAGDPIRDPEDGEVVGLEPTTLEDIVIGLAARQVVEQLVGRSATFGLPEDDRKQVQVRREKIRDAILGAAAEHATEATDAMVRAEFEALIARPGEDGRSVVEETVRQTVARRIEEALKLRPRNDRDRIYRENKSVLETLVGEHVDRAVSNEVKAAINEGKSKVLAEVRTQAAAAYATALGKVSP